MKRIGIMCILLFGMTFLHAQSAEVITQILNSDKATFGQVCYLVAVEEKLIEESSAYAEAIEAMYAARRIPHLVFEDTEVPMVNLAYMYAQHFHIKGGLFYKLFSGAPRYAYKQMKFDGVLPENASPSRAVSGQEVLDIYTSCLMEYTDFELSLE